MTICPGDLQCRIRKRLLKVIKHLGGKVKILEDPSDSFIAFGDSKNVFATHRVESTDDIEKEDGSAPLPLPGVPQVRPNAVRSKGTRPPLDAATLRGARMLRKVTVEA